MSTNTSYRLSKNSQRMVVDFVRARYLSFNISTIREKYQKIDQALQLESPTRRAAIDDSFSDTELPLVAEPVNSAVSFLTKLYLDKPEVFEATTTKKELLPIVSQLQAINQENSKASHWQREFPLYFRDSVKYNFGALEVVWEAETTQEVNTDITSGASGVALTSVLREGNKISRKDPYNCFYDTTVPINLVHISGEFSGYFEPVTMIEMAQRFEKLQVTGSTQTNNPIMNKDKLFKVASTSTMTQFFKPNIRPEAMASRGTNTTIGNFFGTTAGKGSTQCGITTSNRARLICV